MELAQVYKYITSRNPSSPCHMHCALSLVFCFPLTCAFTFQPLTYVSPHARTSTCHPYKGLCACINKPLKPPAGWSLSWLVWWQRLYRWCRWTSSLWQETYWLPIAPPKLLSLNLETQANNCIPFGFILVLMSVSTGVFKEDFYRWCLQKLLLLESEGEAE